MSDYGFIITRHVNSEQTNKYWNHCVKLIRTFYPINQIILIDDNSNPNFIMENGVISPDKFYNSICMISDWSGISLEYAFAFERPVIFIDVPKKILNPNWSDIMAEPIEISIRDKIGHIVSPNNLQEFTDLVLDFVNKPDDLEPTEQDIKQQITNFLIGKTSNENEKNNPFAINLYLLGYDINGNLTNLNRAVKENLKTYINEYRMLTDGINMNDGFVTNIGLEFEIITYPN